MDEIKVEAPSGVKPKRSRIQRGKSRPTVRGSVLTNGLRPIFVYEDGERVDMAEFKPEEAESVSA